MMISIIGTGNMARGIATRMVAGGHTVELHAHDMSKGEELAKELGLPGTAGSDAHQVTELFAVYNQIEAELNVDSVLAAIKKGSVSAHLTGH